MKKASEIEVRGTKVRIVKSDGFDYACRADMAKQRSDDAQQTISNWMRNRMTIEYPGRWESLYNPEFKPTEFDGFRNGVELKVLRSVFAMVPHDWKLKSESEAKRYFLLFMKMAGADICVEEQSAKGRADAVLKTERTIYIFEFKYGRTAREALKQISEKKYMEPYLTDGRAAVAVGVNYDPRIGAVLSVSGEVNGEVKGKDGEVNGEVKSYVSEHPGCGRKDLAEALGLSPRTLDRRLAALVTGGEIEFRGAPKTGGYYVVV